MQGSGNSPEEAIVIERARDPGQGIAAEYAVLEARFGEQGTDWRVAEQALERQQGPDDRERVLDHLLIELSDGGTEELFFDVTAFHGP